VEIKKLYRKLYLIRYFEKRLENLFRERKLKGTMHGCIGQEANAVGILSHIDPEIDWITGNHRSHGHFLAISEDPYPLVAELMGKETGLVKGKGGSQHFMYKHFINNGITGGMVGVGVGIAFALKQKGKGIVVSFFGDGAMNEGHLMESLNLAAYLGVPILLILENNKYAMSTRTEKVMGGSFKDRVQAFGIEYAWAVSDDAEKLYNLGKEWVERVRKERRPLFIEILTHRFSGHSKSDNREYVPPQEDREWKEKDPVEKLRKKIINTYGQKTLREIEKEVEKTVDRAIQKAESDPYPEVVDIYGV